MINFLPFCHRQTPAGALQAFQSATDKANKDGRVSSAMLNNLLKQTKNSSEVIPFEDYKEIRCRAESLNSSLKNQGSKLHAEKSAKINKALADITQKLSPDARRERADIANQAYTSKIDKKLERIENTSIPTAKEYVINLNDDILRTVDNLPTKESRQAGIEIISREDFFEFSENSRTTQRLFPMRTERVERQNGYRNQKFDAPGKTGWVKLKNLCEQRAAVKEYVSQATQLLDHPANFAFGKPDDTGIFNLTAHQRALLTF